MKSIDLAAQLRNLGLVIISAGKAKSTIYLQSNNRYRDALYYWTTQPLRFEEGPANDLGSNVFGSQKD